MTEIEAFNGFPREGLRFFEQIAANNNRDWFQAHKQQYLDYLQTPALAFVVEFGGKLKRIAPDITFDTRTNGAGSLMRIYRDTRFSKDKSPYKSHIGMDFWHGGGKKRQTSGFHFWMDAGGGVLYGGFHGFPKPVLAAYRDAVAAERTGKRLEQVIAKIRAQQGFTVGGEQLKRVPPGYPKDHPRGDLLRYKGLHAHGPTIRPSDLQSSELIEICLRQAKLLAPLHRWLVEIDPTSGA